MAEITKCKNVMLLVIPLTHTGDYPRSICLIIFFTACVHQESIRRRATHYVLLTVFYSVVKRQNMCEAANIFVNKYYPILCGI